MRELDRYRNSMERGARAAMGVQTWGHKGMEASARSSGLESIIAALPVDVDDLAPLQSMVTGSAFFMAGLSAVSGDDEIA
jgi:hypothetical protein